ncbi:MAG: hypothetical protein EWM47_08500 [Anaerolineaceae bacterium]|nr:MAG: hypothetical protein EWM47_08500 [Anaerolineaceae bacterium]
MKRKHISLIALLLIIFSLPLSLLACSKNEVIVEIDDTKLSLDDFLYDIYLIEHERDLWNNKFKESLGIDYFDYEYDGTSMKQLAKNTIMTKVILYEILSDQAKKKGYTLSDEEINTIDENVDKLIASISDVQLKESKMNRDILIKANNKLALADKYYLALIRDFEVNEESIQSTVDSDVYREYKTECLYVPTTEISNKNISPLDEDELDKAYDKIRFIKQLILKGSDFEEILGLVEGAIHYERNFILSDNTAEGEYKEAAKELANGAYSDVITTQFGHYIIHMLDNNSPSRYEMAIESAIKDEKTNQFKIHYDKLLEEYEITINTEYWDSIY